MIVIVEAEVGQPCSDTIVCADPNAECNPNVCSCKDGFRVDTGVCIPCTYLLLFNNYVHIYITLVRHRFIRGAA